MENWLALSPDGRSALSNFWVTSLAALLKLKHTHVFPISLRKNLSCSFLIFIYVYLHFFAEFVNTGFNCFKYQPHNQENRAYFYHPPVLMTVDLHRLLSIF